MVLTLLGPWIGARWSGRAHILLALPSQLGGHQPLGNPVHQEPYYITSINCMCMRRIFQYSYIDKLFTFTPQDIRDLYGAVTVSKLQFSETLV